MKYTHQKPCANWAEQLAADSRKDLTEAERVMLNEHVASCPACAAARYAYRQMDRDLLTMPLIEPHMIHAEQLLERENMLPTFALARNEKLTSSHRMEPQGKASLLKAKPARFPEDFQDQAPATRRARLQRMLSAFAAVLIVCSIIGSALLLFSHHTRPGVGGATNTNTQHLPLYTVLLDGTVYALQPDTGSILWRRQLHGGEQDTFGGPSIVHGVVYVIGSSFPSSSSSLYALRASDGTLLWQRALPAPLLSPISGDDTQVIYVGAGTTLYALHTSDGSELWQRKSDAITSDPYASTMPLAVADGRVYGDDDSGLYALSTSDGHVLWEGKGGFSGVALAVAGDKIFATVGTAEQIEVLRTSDGQVLHMLSVEGNLGFDQGMLYVANQESQKLFILRPEDESITRQVPMACPVSDSPAPLVVQNGLVYTYSWGRSLKQTWLCAMHVSDGKQVWRWTETRRIVDIRSLVAANNHLYFLYTDGDFAQGEIYALSTNNGAPLWKDAFPSNFPYNGYFVTEGESGVISGMR